jgi:hypothetical protein
LSLTNDDADPGKLRFLLELRNTLESGTRVFPGRFCDNVKWPSAFVIFFESDTGVKVNYTVAPYLDTEDVHEHAPLTLEPGQKVQHEFGILNLELWELSPPSRSVHQFLTKYARHRIWLEPALDIEKLKNDEYFHVYLSYYYRHTGTEGGARARKDFEQGWPEWAWRGKLRSNEIVWRNRAGTAVE